MTSYVGMGLKRFEDPQLITGQGHYVDDFHLPGMLHAAVVRSPHAHARIKSIDVASARRAPGVVAVITSEDLEDTSGASPIEPRREGVVVDPPPHPMLARGKVRYVGEPVAVVVAENRYLARDARELVDVEYEVLKPVVDMEDALKDDVILHEDIATNVVIRIDDQEGDLDGAFRKADRIVKARFESQRLCPSAMETRSMLASYDKDSDRLTVWTSSQSPYFEKAGLAYMLKRDRNSIRVIVPEVGGGFGGKAMRPDMAVVAYLAIKLGRPIKMVEDRSENMTNYHGRGMSCQVEAAVTNDGTILGLRFFSICDFGAYFITSSLVSPFHMVHRITGPYKTPVIHHQMRGVVTNMPSTGPYRGAGGPEASFFMERTIDTIAAELGLDPADVRKRNLVPSGWLPYTTPTGLTYDSGDYAKALDRALELADYEGLRRQQAQARAEGRLMGIGMATFVKGVGGGAHLLDSNARVEIDSSGRVMVYTEASPQGQGTETTFAQIAADVLGISPEQSAILHGDTAMLEQGAGTMASRAVIVSAQAVYLALQKARSKMGQIGAHFFNCSSEDVVFQNGKVYPRTAPDRAVPFADIAARAFKEETLPPGVGPGLEFTAEFTLPHYGFPYGSQVVTVEIDRDTGEVKVLGCVGVHDCGVIVNPKLTEGQFHGALAQGLGQAMTEGVVYSPDGQLLTGSFMDYAMPYAEDMPHLLLDGYETPSPTAPMGTKGVGELATIGVPAATANAVVDALSHAGIRHVPTPLTPERVWRILHPDPS